MVSGFEMAVANGPLMDEPMTGSVFVVDEVQLEKTLIEEKEITNSDKYGPIGGQVMSAMKTLCKRAFLNSDPRVVEGMYKCSMQASPETYGIVYSIINKCRGRVI